MALRYCLGLFLFTSSLFATSIEACRSFYFAGYKTSLFQTGYIFPGRHSLRNYREPKFRHQATYAWLTPEANDPAKLTPLKINDAEISLPLRFSKVTQEDKTYFIYEAGESQFLPLNAVYESAVLDFLNRPSLNKQIGFDVRAGVKLAAEITAIAEIRDAALDSVVGQLRDDVEAQQRAHQYTNYNFYRQSQWRMNHDLIRNGDNDVFVILDQTASFKGESAKLDQKVLATVQGLLSD